ncbi:GntP family permease [Glaciecola sp. 1036]|uniref:GntP family permease n=1 Tax=Alteromonadaceae TaxID=72275 RepID=UPI003CFD1B83
MLQEYPLAVALIAIAALLILIIFIRIHAFVSLICVSAFTAYLGGIPFDKIVSTMTAGFGSTLASVALLVGLGAMIGKLLDITGGAQVLADSLVSRFGAKNAPFALGIASLLFGFPIFFDAGLIVMLPVILSVAARFGGSVLFYALPAAGAFAVTHALVPPHPGPVVAGDLLGADIGLLLVYSTLVAIPTWYVGSFLFSNFISQKFMISLPNYFKPAQSVENPPEFSTVLWILLLPLCLIFLNTGLNAYQTSFNHDLDSPLVELLMAIGQTPIALLITLLLSLVLFSRRFSRVELERLCDQSLGPICAIILVTGAGGMFGGVLRAIGVGDSLSSLLSDIGLPSIVAAFIIAASLRIAQGSATVALTTTAAIIAPVVAMDTSLSSADLCFIVIAIAGGASVLSHFNDSGFWLVGRLLQMDEKTTLKTWTPMVTAIGVTAFSLSWFLSLFL